MSNIRYTLQAGEFIFFVASRFGFGSLDPIAGHPDNQEVIQKRGGVFWLREGDTITIPEGKAGKKNLAPGRGHVVKVKQLPDTLLLVVEVGFRLQHLEAVGDITRTSCRWPALGGALPVADATASFSRGGAARHTTSTDRRGRLVVPLLEDGEWTLQLDPDPAERSAGPAGAKLLGGHKLEKEFGPGKPTKFFEAEYQPLTIALTIAGGKVDSARVTAPTPKDRPVPAVVFWRGVDGGKSRQVLHVDWKPDFLRRVGTRAKPGMDWAVRPEQRKRSATIDLIMVHQTAGTEIGGALNTFFSPKESSGAHFVNDLDGHLVRLADDDCHTQHGGGYNKVRKPDFDGGNVNERAIGIENVHADANHLDPAQNPFTDAQYKTLIDLIKGLRKQYGVPLRKVVGHQDATPKARCPGPHFDWPRLEKAGASMAPLAVDEAERERMFGGFFAGEDGRKRRLSYGDEEAGSPGAFQIKRGDKVVADALRERPIECIHRALYAIGYDPTHQVSQGKKSITHQRGRFDVVLAFCLSQFVRHFATGSRIRSDQSKAYLEIPLGKEGRYNKVEMDFDLAVLLRGAELAAQAEPRVIVRPIRVDQ